MAQYWAFLFGEADAIHIQEIAKIHNVPVEVLEKHYKQMLEGVKNELQNKVED